MDVCFFVARQERGGGKHLGSREPKKRAQGSRLAARGQVSFGDKIGSAAQGLRCEAGTSPPIRLAGRTSLLPSRGGSDRPWSPEVAGVARAGAPSRRTRSRASPPGRSASRARPAAGSRVCRSSPAGQTRGTRQDVMRRSLDFQPTGRRCVAGGATPVLHAGGRRVLLRPDALRGRAWGANARSCDAALRQAASG